MWLLSKYCVILSLIVTSLLAGQKSPINTNKTAYVIGGFDIVAYFTQKKALKGVKKYQYHWENVTWLFSSKKNLTLFKANPMQYKPQFGGYCAYGVSKGRTPKVSPSDSWHISKGKLYLNYNYNVLKRWIKRKNYFIAKAKKNWPGVLTQK